MSLPCHNHPVTIYYLPQVAIKIVSMAEAPVEFSQKFLPREISSLNATYKHLNVVGSSLGVACPILKARPYHTCCPAQACPPPQPGTSPWSLGSKPNPILNPGSSTLRSAWTSLAQPSLRVMVVGVWQVQLYETYQNSQRFYLVLELAARGDLLEHINAVSDHRQCPGLEEEEARRLFWQLVSAVAHCHNAGIVHR